ncbi:hypothetical protein PG988_011533 [Apiospora saccharicola]
MRTRPNSPIKLASRLEGLAITSSSTQSSRQSHRVTKTKPRNNNYNSQAHQALVRVPKEYSHDKDLLELYLRIDVRSAKALFTGVEKRLCKFSGTQRIQGLARFLRIALKRLDADEEDESLNPYHQKAHNLLQLLEAMLAAYADPSSPVQIEPSIEPLLLKHEWFIDPTVLWRITSPSPRVAFITVGGYISSLVSNVDRFSDKESASTQAWLSLLDRVTTSTTITADADKNEDKDEHEKKKKKREEEGEEEEGIRLTLLILRATLVLWHAEENPGYARYLSTGHVYRVLRSQKKQQQNLAKPPPPEHGIRFDPRTSDALKAACIDYFAQTMAAVQAFGGIRPIRRRLLYATWVF